MKRLKAREEKAARDELAIWRQCRMAFKKPTSAQAAGRGAKRKRNSADLAEAGESVVRELLKSAQAARRGAKRKRNSADLAEAGESVVREFFQNWDKL